MPSQLSLIHIFFDRPFDVVKHADRFMLFMFEFLVIKGEGAEIGALGALARRIGADFGLFRGCLLYTSRCV